MVQFLVSFSTFLVIFRPLFLNNLGSFQATFFGQILVRFRTLFQIQFLVSFSTFSVIYWPTFWGHFRPLLGTVFIQFQDTFLDTFFSQLQVTISKYFWVTLGHFQGTFYRLHLAMIGFSGLKIQCESCSFVFSLKCSECFLGNLLLPSS